MLGKLVAWFESCDTALGFHVNFIDFIAMFFKYFIEEKEANCIQPLGSRHPHMTRKLFTRERKEFNWIKFSASVQPVGRVSSRKCQKHHSRWSVGIKKLSISPAETKAKKYCGSEIYFIEFMLPDLDARRAGKLCSDISLAEWIYIYYSKCLSYGIDTTNWII